MRIIGSSPRLVEGGERVGLVIHLGKQRNNKHHLPLGVISDSFLITSADVFTSQSHLLTALSPLKSFIFVTVPLYLGHAVAQLVEAGSIPDSVIGIFH